jgi:hypothetical protein
MNTVNDAILQLESCRYKNGEKTVEWLRAKINDSSLDEIISGKWPE